MKKTMIQAVCMFLIVLVAQTAIAQEKPQLKQKTDEKTEKVEKEIKKSADQKKVIKEKIKSGDRLEKAKDDAQDKADKLIRDQKPPTDDDDMGKYDKDDHKGDDSDNSNNKDDKGDRDDASVPKTKPVMNDDEKPKPALSALSTQRDDAQKKKEDREKALLASLERGEQRVMAGRARIKTAKERFEKELKTGAITQEQYDARMAKVAEAEAAIDRLEASIKNGERVKGSKN